MAEYNFLCSYRKSFVDILRFWLEIVVYKYLNLKKNNCPGVKSSLFYYKMFPKLFQAQKNPRNSVILNQRLTMSSPSSPNIFPCYVINHPSNCSIALTRHWQFFGQ